MRPHTRLPALLLLSGTLVAAPLPAAEPTTEDAAAAFGERIAVDLVEVEVHVDHDRGSVDDLERDDFRLLVDGEPVEIVGFSRRTAEATATGLDDVTGTTAGRAATPEREPVYLAIYVDDSNLLPQGRARLFARLDEFLAERLDATTSAMVVRFTRNLEVVTPLTRDAKEIRRILADLADDATALPASLREEQEVLRELRFWADAPPLTPPTDRGGGGGRASRLSDGPAERCEAEKLDRMNRVVQRFTLQREAEVMAALGATLATIEAMAPLDGRKVIVYLADHLPHRPGHRFYEFLRELCPPAVADTRFLESPDSRIPNFLGRVAARAASSGVTIYSFQPSGLAMPGAADVTVEVPTGGAARDAARWDDEDTLFTLAADTGGRAFFHRNDFADALADVARDLDNYYSLAFDAGALGHDDHRVEVEVTRPGVRVRHRRRVAVHSPAERSRDEVLAALAGLGSDLPGDLAARLEVGRVAEVDRRRYEVSLWLRLPLAELVFVPDAGRERASLSLTLTAEDERGRRTPTQAVVVPIELSSAELDAKRAAGDFLYEMKTTMRRGEHRLALRVEDVTSGATDLVVVDVVVPIGG